MPPIGARPGSLQIPEGSPPPRIHLIDYSPAGYRETEHVKMYYKLARF